MIVYQCDVCCNVIKETNTIRKRVRVNDSFFDVCHECAIMLGSSGIKFGASELLDIMRSVVKKAKDDS
jgi:ribosome-binding protein aMBF1 (putative translation factor)